MAHFDNSSRRIPVLTTAGTDPSRQSICKYLYSATISSLSTVESAYLAQCREKTHGQVLAALLAFQTGLTLNVESGVVRYIDDWLDRFDCQYATDIDKENEKREYPYSYGRVFKVEEPTIDVEVSKDGVEVYVGLFYSETYHVCQEPCLTKTDGGECAIKAEQDEHGLARFCPSLSIKRKGNVWEVQSDPNDDTFWIDGLGSPSSSPPSERV